MKNDVWERHSSSTARGTCSGYGRDAADGVERVGEGKTVVANVFRMGEEVRRKVEGRLVLRRINRRQKALRRSWYQLPRAEVGAELVAIGHELLAAAPLFLPRSFDSGGGLVGANGVGLSRNGKLGWKASWSVHHDGAASGGAAWGEFVRLARQALTELEGLLRELSRDPYQG